MDELGSDKELLGVTATVEPVRLNAYVRWGRPLVGRFVGCDRTEYHLP